MVNEVPKQSEHLSSLVYRLTPEEYDGILRCINGENLKSLGLIMPKLPKKGICIIVVGSDGKLERHPQSKTEIVVVSDNFGKGLTTSQKIADKTNAKASDIHFDFKPTGIPEYKILDGKYTMSYAYNDRNRVYPDRILNSSFVVGDEEVHIKARVQTLREMGEKTIQGKRIREKIKKQLFDYSVACAKGIYRELDIFDQDLNIQIYDERMNVFGFKQAFLRSVQRRLDYITAQAVLNEQLNPIDCILELPSNTVDRLIYFSEQGLINMPNIHEITRAYQWFLQKYHEVQEQYKITGEGVYRNYDPTLFENYRKLILNFIR